MKTSLAIALANLGAFLWQSSLPRSAIATLWKSRAAIPSSLLGATPDYSTLLTCQFLHASWLHLGGNLLYFQAFAPALEEQMGSKRFTFLYLASGAIGTFVQCLSSPSSQTPILGASAAIAGAMGAYAILFPSRPLVCLVGIVPVPIPLYVFLAVWGFQQSLILSSSKIAAIAHLVGLISGAAIAILLGGKNVFATR